MRAQLNSVQNRAHKSISNHAKAIDEALILDHVDFDLQQHANHNPAIKLTQERNNFQPGYTCCHKQRKTAQR